MGYFFLSNLTPVSVAPYQWIKFGMHTFLKNYDNFEAELIASSDWNRDHIPRQTDQFYFLGHWQRKWSRKWDLEWWCRLAAVFTKRCKITELKTKPDPVADNNWVSQFVFRKWCCMHCSNQLKKKKNVNVKLTECFHFHILLWPLFFVFNLMHVSVMFCLMTMAAGKLCLHLGVPYLWILSSFEQDFQQCVL